MIARGLALLLALAGSVPAGAQPRADAVFVLGSDRDSARAFFGPAEQHFAARLVRDRDLLVTTARTLEEVREWLARAPARGERPWGTVTLVAHGSPWVGLAVPLFRDGAAPASASALRAAIHDGTFPALDDAIVDADTRLVLDSCGVGRRHDLLALYSQLLGGDLDHPQVVASAAWIEFGSSGRAGELTTWRRERPFTARVVPPIDAAGAADRAEPGSELRATLQRELQRAGAAPDDLAAARWQLAPIRIDAAIADLRLCAGARALTQLTRQRVILGALTDHGLRRSQLRWRIEHSTGQCHVVGEATLATLAVGGVPPLSLPPSG